ncbi:Sickle tail protein [Liparis tanakae]|uniref:Sickle tail protein n=1 Tax=Liparis tanakae TaxID=230148 RepID=A0A4Z2EM22_9TELE|nr:Sickle tail protein [Liparis tanakae]
MVAPPTRCTLHGGSSHQLSQQEAVSSMLRMAGQELVVLMEERLAQSEEAGHRRRGMEEERIHYLATEEGVLTQLSGLEDYVDRLQRSSASSPDQLCITLRDVEEGAVSLRRAGEALATLKGGFPELQGKMRSVLRLEVEAVRFLKEEPHKMDSMLKRVKALTEALGALRRCVSESTIPARPAQVEPLKILETDPGPLEPRSPQSSPKPQPRSSVRPPLTASLSGGLAEVRLAGRMKTDASGIEQPRPQLTDARGRSPPSVAKVSPRSREGSPALQRRRGPMTSPTHEGQADHTPVKQSPERRSPLGRVNPASQPLSAGSRQLPSPSANTEDQVLQASQASPMETTPPLNASGTREGCSAPASRPTQAAVEPPARRSGSQDAAAPPLSDEADSPQAEPPDTAAPPSAAPSTEHISRPRVEKPPRTAVDKEMKPSPDRVGSAPPPPAPRRSVCQ